MPGTPPMKKLSPMKKTLRSGSVPDNISAPTLALNQSLPNEKFKAIPVGCDSCDSWTTITIPIKRAKIIENELYLCGFCSVKELHSVRNELTNVNINIEDIKERQEHLTTICQNINELNKVSKMCEERSKAIEEKLDKVLEKQLRSETPTRPASRQNYEINNKLQEFKFFQEKLSKENNIILKGLKISTDMEPQVLNILSAMDLADTYKDKITNIVKVGNFISKNNTATFKVSFSTNKAPKDMLRNRYRLKDKDNCKNIYIENDKTKEELYNHYKLRKELQERRKKGEQCIIRNNKIISKINDNTMTNTVPTVENTNDHNITTNENTNKTLYTTVENTNDHFFTTNENTNNTLYKTYKTNPFLC